MGLEWEHRSALPDSKPPFSEPWEQRGSCMPGRAGSRDCCLYNTAAKNVSQCKRGRNCSLRMMQKALTKDGLMLLSPKEKQNRILPTRAIRRSLATRLTQLPGGGVGLCDSDTCKLQEGQAATDPLLPCISQSVGKGALQSGGRRKV